MRENLESDDEVGYVNLLYAVRNVVTGGVKLVVFQDLGRKHCLGCPRSNVYPVYPPDGQNGSSKLATSGGKSTIAR